MKTFCNVLLIGLACGLSCRPFSARADLEVAAAVQIHATTDFHEPLAPHGVWVEVGPYGHCWRPTAIAVDWRPYCDGHWVWTDCGWYWVSAEPWAWACYHYGWWVHDSFHGWVWVPGIEWAPAWVHWRVGGGYVGWAPRPPRGVIVAPASFVFVGVHHFHERVKPSKLIVNNTAIINKTTQITEFKRETRSFANSKPQQVIINEGPGVDVIQKATGKRIHAVPIREAVRQTPVPRSLTPPVRERLPKENPPTVQEPSKPTPDQKPAPGGSPAPPAKPSPPKQGKPPKDAVIPPVGPTPGPGTPPPSPPGPPKGKGKGKDKDKP